jgi:hypothetical protein
VEACTCSAPITGSRARSDTKGHWSSTGSPETAA